MPVVMISSTAAYDKRFAALSCLRTCFVPNSSALNIQPNMCLPNGTGDNKPPLCTLQKYVKHCNEPGRLPVTGFAARTGAEGEEILQLECRGLPWPGYGRHRLHQHSIQPCQRAARPHWAACRCTASSPAHSQSLVTLCCGYGQDLHLCHILVTWAQCWFGNTGDLPWGAGKSPSASMAW